MKNFLKGTDMFNSPELAYYVRTGKIIHVPGFYANHQTRKIKGIDIDKNIPKNEMLLLLNNPKIEMRSSCEGSDIYGPFFIFRLVNFHDHEHTNKFCELMNKGVKYKKIICRYSIGRTGNEFRIIVTSTFTKDEVDLEECKKWWKITTKKVEIISKHF